MHDDTALKAAAHVLDLCRAQNWLLATAESCTGGLIAGALTEIAGSSDVVDRGFVTYSNAAKIAMLSVPQDMIEAHGAVSEQVARAMAEGALAHSPADVAIAVTGIAGPGGGSAEKPVGLVHFGCAARHHAPRHKERRFGDVGRSEIRRLTVVTALAFIEEVIREVSVRSA